jgi:hypothetical protein
MRQRSDPRLRRLSRSPRQQRERSHGASLARRTILALFCLIVQDDSQWIECRRLDELQGVRVVMIEWLVATFDQKLGCDAVGPASVIVEGDVAAVAGGPESLVQEFGRADSITRIATLRRDGDCLVVRLCTAGGEKSLAAGIVTLCRIKPVAGSQSQ